MIAILATLSGLLMSGVQKVRASAARAACMNNLKQIGISLLHYESRMQKLPPAFPAVVKPPYTTGLSPAYFWSWSVLSELNPYFEQTAIYNSLNLDHPVFILTPPSISPGNDKAAGTVVPLFLCPADRMKSISGGYGVAEFGPTNYAACLGTGMTKGSAPYGSPWNADGAFQAKIKNTMDDIRDGVSNTVAFSESSLGDGAESHAGDMPAAKHLVMGYVSSPLDPAKCAAPPLQWNFTNRRGYLWMTGEIRSGSYNHYFAPNADAWDCVTNVLGFSEQAYTAVGFRAARSHHPGGVNVLLLDGAVRFATNTINLDTWRALGTRAGSERLGEW